MGKGSTMNNITKTLLGVLTILLLFSQVSALEFNTTTTTDTSILIELSEPINASQSPEIYINNKLIETPIRDKIFIDDLTPDTSYYITLYFNHPESPYYGDYYQIETKTLQPQNLSIESAIYQYGYILLILLVLIGIAYVKLPFGGFIPFFMTIAGLIHYTKYSIIQPTTIIIYMVLVIISAYVIYIREVN